MSFLKKGASRATEAGISQDEASESKRMSPRRTATYTSYLPSRPTTPTGMNDLDPLLCNDDRIFNPNKVCLRSSYNDYINPPTSKTRWFHYLPVAFVVLSFIFVYGVFMIYHVKPAVLEDFKHGGILSKKTAVVVLSTSVLTVLFIVSYVLCASVDPGEVPDTPEWSFFDTDEKAVTPVLCETKKSGLRRSCKWCQHYKPDRTHHCRICNRCVLKMDHHCPWVQNCIGWRNHKYFFLSLFYASVLSSLIACISYPNVKHVISNPSVNFNEFTMILVAEVLAVFFGLVCGLFLCFHIYLICEAFTTIEFCEKRSSSAMLLNGSIWSAGLRNNIACVLGENPLLWLLPIDDRVGDGITFNAYLPVEERDDNDEYVYDENSVFLKMARDTKQFEPIMDV
ncbi:zinc finger DHHC domain containing protein [Babesia gibsoni]|uniref:Palmitoyltransferase n=1 Tax=Babesia gibsoni TaxID=33632 RepID=A0AAD8PFX1_BABGI|nr:zinc finger DHHC domain containing protein [Babesia gibsoni]